MNKRLAARYACLSCALACALVWYGVYRVESRRDLIVHFFDVGQGDGIMIDLPNHRQVVIDGGPGNNMAAKLGDALWFWDRTIDLVILTHPHADHIDGLIDVIKRYHIGMIIESGADYATPDHEEWNRIIKEKHIPVVYARRGQRVRLSDNSLLDIFSPRDVIAGRRLSDIHDAMVVTKLSYGSTTMLFSGDAERPVEYEMIGSHIDVGADVLKIGHHGSKTSSTEIFLNAVRPQMAVISAGRNNRYGHPHQEVVDRIRGMGIRLFRTDIDGDIELMSDGVRVRRAGELKNAD